MDPLWARIINVLAERQAAGPEAVSVIAIREIAPAEIQGARGRVDAALTALEQHGYLVVQGAVGTLTLEGWLESKYCGPAAAAIEGALALYQREARKGATAPELDWDRLREIARLPQEDIHVAWWALREAGLVGGGSHSGSGFGATAPRDHERWADVSEIAEFREQHRRDSLEELAVRRRLPKDLRTACELAYDHLRTHGTWPNSRVLGVQLHDRSIELSQVVRSAPVLIGDDLSSPSARSYITLLGLPLVESAKADVVAAMGVLRELGVRYAADPMRETHSFHEAAVAAGLDDVQARRVLQILLFQGDPFRIDHGDHLEKATIRTGAEFLPCRHLANVRMLLGWLHQVWPIGPPEPMRLQSSSLGASTDVVQSFDSVDSETRHLTNGEEPFFSGDPPWIRATPQPVIGDKRTFRRAVGQGVDVLLVTATEVERDAVIRRMVSPDDSDPILKVPLGDLVYFLGRIGESIVALVMSRIGAGLRDGSGFTIDEAIRACHPRAIIAVGIAWGMDTKRFRIGDVLISSRIIPFDIARRQDGGDIHRSPQPEAGRLLLNRFRNETAWHFERPDGYVCKYKDGPILSGESLVDSLEFKKGLHTQYRDAIGGEMEGTGVYGASAKHRSEWIVVKAICDWGDGTKHDNHQTLAAAAAVSLVEQVISPKQALADLDHIEPVARRFPLAALAVGVILILATVITLKRYASSKPSDSPVKESAPAQAKASPPTGGRPFLRVSAKLRAQPSFSADSGGSVPVDFIVTNTGGAPANSAYLSAAVVFSEDLFLGPRGRLAEICDPLRREHPSGGEFSPIFPGTSLVASYTFSFTHQDMIFQEQKLRGMVSPSIVGCVDYLAPDGGVHHQTSFEFDLSGTDANGASYVIDPVHPRTIVLRPNFSFPGTAD